MNITGKTILIGTARLKNTALYSMAMPHVMFYAPHVTNADIGARPSLSDPASLQYPLVDRQGNGEQTYVVQMVGEAERAAIMVREKPLLDDLCAYRRVLCLAAAHK